MPSVHIEQDGLSPSLTADQLLICGHCGREWTPADLGGFAEGAVGHGHGYPWHVEAERPYCESCDGYGAFKVITVRPGVSARWSEAVAKQGWSPRPDLLTLHGCRDLGLDPTDLAILDAYEVHRRRAGQAVYPTLDRIAAVVCLDESNVRKRLAKMVRSGLIEKHDRGRQPNGHKRSNAYTRLGLNQVLDHIGRNIEGGADPLDGVAALRTILQKRASATGRQRLQPPGASAYDHRAPAPGEAVAVVEAEKNEPDPYGHGLSSALAGEGDQEHSPGLTALSSDDSLLEVTAP